MVIIYNFVKINFIHPQEEPLEHHLGDIRPIKLMLLNTVKRTGRVDILWCIFEKIAKKIKMKDQKNNILVNISKKRSKSVLFGSCGDNFNFLTFFIAQTCITRFVFQLLKS